MWPCNILYFFVGAGPSIPYWDFHGSTFISTSYIRLTPDHQSKTGGLWNSVVGIPDFFLIWPVTCQRRQDGLILWIFSGPSLNIGYCMVFLGKARYLHSVSLNADLCVNECLRAWKIFKIIESQFILWTGMKLSYFACPRHANLSRYANNLPGSSAIGQVRMNSYLSRRKIYMSRVTEWYSFLALSPANVMLQVTLQWISIPSRGE